MNVDIKFERRIEVVAPFIQVAPLLNDLEATLRRFPKLRKLTKLGADRYLWEMAAIGSDAANISHQVSYGALYRVDAARGEVSWTSLPEFGNATIDGRFRLVDQGQKTQLVFEVSGRLREVPVPLMYRLLAPAFIQGRFSRLAEIFLEATRDAALSR